jgi:hypothetical protein
MFKSRHLSLFYHSLNKKFFNFEYVSLDIILPTCLQITLSPYIEECCFLFSKSLVVWLRFDGKEMGREQVCISSSIAHNPPWKVGNYLAHQLTPYNDNLLDTFHVLIISQQRRFGDWNISVLR